MATSNEDLNRSIGRLEGDVTAVKERMDRLEATIVEGMNKLEQALREVQADVAEIKAREHERRGAWKALTVIAAAVGGVAGTVISYFFGK